SIQALRALAASVPAKRLDAAASASSRAVSNTIPLGCNHVLFPDHDAKEQGQPHLLPEFLHIARQLLQALPQTTPRAAQFARTSASQSPAPLSLRTKQNCVRTRTRMFLTGMQNNEAPLRALLLCPAKGARTSCRFFPVRAEIHLSNSRKRE